MTFSHLRMSFSLAGGGIFFHVGTKSRTRIRVRERKPITSAVWAFYVQVAVPMRLPDAGRLMGSNLPEAGFGPTSCRQTTDLQSLVGFLEVFFS